MNILDENIPKPQRELLEGWGVKVKQIGVNVGHKGILDDETSRFCIACAALPSSPATKIFTRANSATPNTAWFI